MRRDGILASAILFSTFWAGALDIIITFAGGGANDLPAVDANLDNPADVEVDSVGNIYIAAQGQQRVFKVDTAGVLTVVAGDGTYGYKGDGGPATSANQSRISPWCGTGQLGQALHC